jgi:hypothetical protein
MDFTHGDMPSVNAGDASHREGVFDRLVRARTSGVQDSNNECASSSVT